MRFTAPGIALIGYGVLNAVLYASLLPLWEGFDEPFHYSYVQDLSSGRGLPVLGRTALSGEVWASLRLAPGSEAVVRHNLPQMLGFGEYFALPDAARRSLRARLEGVSPAGAGYGGNYEAHQAPLAYGVLAVADRFWRHANLIDRVWRLRVLCGVTASVGTAVLLFMLGVRLQLPPGFQEAMVFAVLSSQMFYATTAHIANDWLAVPLTVLLFERLTALMEEPRMRNVVFVALVLAAGLLTKSYFLAMIPVVFGVVAWVVRQYRLPVRMLAAGAAIVSGIGGPWYVRNLLLYRNVSGMQETKGGTEWTAVARAFVDVPWLRSLRELVYGSLWTGNNTFRTFSLGTLNLILAGITAGVVLFAWDAFRGKARRAETVLAAGCIVWAAALAFDTALIFFASRGEAIAASPWYTQPVAPVFLAIVFCALSRHARVGRAIAIWLVGLSGYVIVATYWAKLIPLYGGYEGRTSLRLLADLYRHHSVELAGVLGTMAMRSAAFVFWLAACTSLMAVAIIIGLSREIVRSGQ